MSTAKTRDGISIGYSLLGDPRSDIALRSSIRSPWIANSGGLSLKCSRTDVRLRYWTAAGTAHQISRSVPIRAAFSR